MEAILCVIWLVLFFVHMHHAENNFNSKVDNYDLKKVDQTKMCSDQYMNNLSGREVQRNMINGKYDKK